MWYRSTLMFGGDLPSLDAFTLSLLTSKAVLKMHRESTGVKQLYQQDGKVAITSFNPETGEHYLALFNLSNSKEAQEVSVHISDLGMGKKVKIRDLWSGKRLGKRKGKISVPLTAHASVLYSLK